MVIHGGFWQSSHALDLRTAATVPLSQSRAYVDRARAAGDDARLVQVPGDHLALIDPSTPTWRRTVEALAALTAAG